VLLGYPRRDSSSASRVAWTVDAEHTSGKLWSCPHSANSAPWKGGEGREGEGKEGKPRKGKGREGNQAPIHVTTWINCRNLLSERIQMKKHICFCLYEISRKET
jgi:hypothetical protein